MSAFNLRPHHGLCISFFEGKGYDDRFTEHMKNCIRILEEKNPSIRLVCSVDQICSHCPHCQDVICYSDCKVQCYDRTVLNDCNLKENQILNWREFHEIIYEKILNSKNIAEICTDCQWLTICEVSQKIKNKF
ncbi:MAG: DUF1284 domain-containing protein [Oscillospiraceae bacterium]|nr:DUF1284 domain-containing protein [Oscillospiraceae bacterium]